MIELRPDQKDVAKKLVEMLKTHPVVGLQAPTGWGKTIAALEVIKELGVRALWLVPRLSIGLHVFNHALKLGLRTLATAGRERLCSRNYSMLDFVRGVLQ
jgi:superfamily II DNA or RNA helicase